ncbi:D-alanyl-D-alanine carboxypeptidase/D-alanyl-D-alanine endopeptidase [Pseudobacteriovorax antillogorgiicola]|uniref:D-alanyl-D-alanine carboxypeptidase / D-alanyl-D-alanine-endopeptidase (Penicillin-binding protein 4) n=1 Tax=Pseudobacteriovorax antillogorgiicola TaxID=1513793 RepID=A0A1Y6CHQ6_9BACT|nr:D-alanyl-D-alanine carboxypeptidase/D-alanyl-D-alanine-endopeptidase [Pseudobacteriovorax antillogorgiicola]TCS46641.1 D-alanyl-D-alanine carboxypeptidase/D-alanyl-D-alanine-endopeptidase (penicillin-binding protein 4) [Pseudobacteriovorax antillogorgiicola]SMF66241.1 D-alanyl-D-alanine carboxypeptidase / D-alanyl-D-alanine-endopeptidase (penicillin-binding protein 4) [Pseudobacteriovorax antillogorgiicola]
MLRIITLLLVLISSSAQSASPFYKLGTAHQQSVLFKRLKDGKLIYQKNPDRLLSPASVTKLFTSAAALAKFSPAHQFETKFFYTGTKKQGVISGDLYIVGDGDPLLISEKLWQMAADFRMMGIKEISGRIVIDNSLFDGDTRDDSREDSRYMSNNAYDAPVSAFGINFNTFPVAIAPGYQEGRPAFMSIDPYPIDGIEVSNRVVTTSRGKPYVRVTRSSKKDMVLVASKGRISLESPMRKVYRSVSDPLRTGGEQIRSFLAKENIVVKGQVAAGKLPQAATELYTIKSYELSRMISGLNKYSNNYIADVLVKRMGAEFSGAGPGSFTNGMAVLKDFLAQEVKLPKGFQLYNGSGLDTRNRVNASQVVALLEYMYQRMDLFPEFLASLPAAGWDGTLEDRFDQDRLKPLHGQVRAKTGTLTSPITVSSLAGYLGHPEHGMIAFAIIENGVTRKQQPSVLDFRARQELALKAIIDRF